MTYSYQRVYVEHVASANDLNSAVGGGDERAVGEAQLNLLKLAGLKPSDDVFELGCGTGRLFECLYPELSETGSWFGVDVVPALVERSQRRASDLGADPGRFSAALVDGLAMNLSCPRPPSLICAFSVFTHMEMEDVANTLRALLTIAGEDVRAMFSYLPLEYAFGRAAFEIESAMTTGPRYDRVRNVAVTRDMAIAVAELSGWRVTQTLWREHPNPYDERGLVRTNQTYLILSR